MAMSNGAFSSLALWIAAMPESSDRQDTISISRSISDSSWASAVLWLQLSSTISACDAMGYPFLKRSVNL